MDVHKYGLGILTYILYRGIRGYKCCILFLSGGSSDVSPTVGLAEAICSRASNLNHL